MQREQHSHECRMCSYLYTPTETESEDCPCCGSDGFHSSYRSRGVPLDRERLAQELVQAMSSAAGRIHNALDGLYGDLSPVQHAHLLKALSSAHTTIDYIRKAIKP